LRVRAFGRSDRFGFLTGGRFSTGGSFSGRIRGVEGKSVDRVGVYGQTGDPVVPPIFPPGIGVLGAGNFGYGIVGWSTGGQGILGLAPNSTAIIGSSSSGIGVHGASDTNAGLQGSSDLDDGVLGVSGVKGPFIPFPDQIAGIVGTSNTRSGVIGTSKAQVGVFGYSTNSVGIFGITDNPASFAGVFNGRVAVNGTLIASVKNGVVPFPDGSKRLLHCMESPEHWFEDFGTAKLGRGRAVVKIDASFAKVIKRGDYRVFVTPEGDCQGLYVRRKSANSFEVRELTGGKSSVAFSYRIVGRRKDIKQHRRFAKVDMPLPLPTRPPRAPRKPAPTAAGLRAFVARVEKEARERLPKGRR
jgi:hypothetical protein